MASGKGKAMKKFYDENSDSIVTIEQIEKEFHEFQEEGLYTDQNFSEYLQNCMDYNNGSLTTLETKIERLTEQLNRYSLIPDNDNTELILQIEQIKKEL